MKEIRGDLFSYLGRMKFRIFITTNGSIRQDGKAVMGRGNAAQAVHIFRDKFNQDLQDLVAKAIRNQGNKINKITAQLYTFPVKYEWYDRARRRLIRHSVRELKHIIKRDKEAGLNLIYVVPRPGCGNGSLQWNKDVKPLVKHLPDNVWFISNWDDPQWNPRKGTCGPYGKPYVKN